MNLSEMVTTVRDALTVKRVFGEPYEKDGVTIIPAASVSGGGGGGGGHDQRGGEGEGGGFGLNARPAGAYIVRDGEVRWLPAVDINRLVVCAGLIATVAMITSGRIVNARAKGRRR